MFDGLTAETLARMQFAFTVSFHIIFPAFSIGLASYLAVLNAQWLRTRDETYYTLFEYWKKDLRGRLWHGGRLRYRDVLPVWHQLVGVLG